MVVAVLPAFPGAAWADAPSAPDAGPPAAAPSGVAILARPGAEDAAWALAKEVYARPSLRPASLDEPRARVLVGNAAASDAAQGVKDLADERAGVHGDDGGSRALLRTIASQLNVRAIVVVEAAHEGAPSPSARVFVSETGTFDAARYDADPRPATPAAAPTVDAGAPPFDAGTSDGGMSPPVAVAPPPPPPPVHWSGTVASLDRAYGIGGPEHGPALATSEVPPPPPPATESHPFYTSPWFWGAVGAAAFGGVAVYFATRDNSTDTIHLELQVPK